MKDVPLSLLSEYRRNLSIQVAISEEDTFASVMAPTLALFCMDVTGSVIRSELIALPYSSLADVYRQATMARKSHSLYPTIGQKEVLSDTNITTSVTAPVNHLFLCMDVKGCLIRPEMIDFPYNSLADFYTIC